MNVIIPLAGEAKRLRPLSYSTPKPLFPIAGKTILERILIQLTKLLSHRQLNALGMVVSPAQQARKEVMETLTNIAQCIAGISPRFFVQERAEGTAHAIWCARDLLDEDEVVIAFADTIFLPEDYSLERNCGHLWTYWVNNPSSYGVVVTDHNGYITKLVEKPHTPVSHQAIIGVYHLPEGKSLLQKIEYLLVNNIREKGEFQITTALQLLADSGVKLKSTPVKLWLDCGNPEEMLTATAKVLKLEAPHKGSIVAETAHIKNSTIHPPCFLGEDTAIVNSVVGPYSCIEKGVKIVDSQVSHSIILKEALIENSELRRSIVGAFATVQGFRGSLAVADFSRITGGE